MYGKTIIRPAHSLSSHKRPLSSKNSKTINMNIVNQAY